jgi:purine-cytosine permease-like protein
LAGESHLIAAVGQETVGHIDLEVGVAGRVVVDHQREDCVAISLEVGAQDIGGAILDLYSSGLALVSIGLPVRRHVAASIDAVIMLVGTVYIVWHASDFIGPFQGFLITLGVPIAVWSAIFVADVVMRKRDYAESELFLPSGRYGSWNLRSIFLVLIGSIIGWGFVTNPFASWLSWQGYFMDAIGGKEGPWAYANLGVVFSLVIGFIGHLILARKAIQRQEDAPYPLS